MTEELQKLLDCFWIVREEDPEWYYRVREQETALRAFLRDKLGCQLVLNAHVAKIEKVPGEAQAWMGLQELQQPLDYCLLMLSLAYLEDKGSQEQFVLSDLTEYIVNMAPEETAVDWTVFSQRRCLVRVLKLLREYGMIRMTDGDHEEFAQSEETEVLYESTGLSRYFMRNFATDITDSGSAAEILGREWLDTADDRGIVRRHRVYRKLIFGPVIYSQGPDDADFLYVRNYRNILAKDGAEHLNAQLHVHPTSAMLVQEGSWGSGFPEGNNMSDIALQLAAMIREHVAEGLWDVAADDTLEMTLGAFEELVDRCRQRNAEGWYKTYREMKLEKLVQEVLAYLESWNMALSDEGLRTVRILPLAVKLQGQYPESFTVKEGLPYE